MQYIKKILILSLILTLISSGCQSKKEYSYEISTDEKLEEYDELWKFLEENFSGYLENLDDLGVDKDQLKKDYREKIGDSKDFDEYYNLLNNFISEFQFLGHMEIVNPRRFMELNKDCEDYEKIKKGELEIAPKDLSFRALKTKYEEYGSFFLDEKSIKRYEEICVKQGISLENKTHLEEKRKEVSNLKIRTYKDKETIYIKYPIFLYEYSEVNIENIINELNKFNYKKLIIDIHGNPGGYQYIWKDLVSKLISDDVSWTERYVFQGEKAIECAEKYIKIYDYKDDEVVRLDNKLITQRDYEIKPSSEIKNKAKKIYIIQGDSKSAAEQFCNFSRETGWGTRIGQPIGGSGQGTTGLYKLMNSNLLIRLFLSYPRYPDGQLKDLTIEPDILMDYNVHDILDYVFNDEI